MFYSLFFIFSLVMHIREKICDLKWSTETYEDECKCQVGTFSTIHCFNLKRQQQFFQNATEAMTALYAVCFGFISRIKH